ERRPAGHRGRAHARALRAHRERGAGVPVRGCRRHPARHPARHAQGRLRLHRAARGPRGDDRL
ncbi:MAG: hypothetical protein AVDCRST_MAG35-158, partial [uncultured Quadrisphaera sp.]